jgi:hypothetical protein
MRTPAEANTVRAADLRHRVLEGKRGGGRGWVGWTQMKSRMWGG